MQSLSVPEEGWARGRAALLARIDAVAAELLSHERRISNGFSLLSRRVDVLDAEVSSILGV